jgi:2-polyprenyl-6-methoxyphenol hydroxylase-like FAD-dependent oxidoreductase
VAFVEEEEYDVAIVGNGPVGAATAALLGSHGIETAVYERFATPYGLPRAIRLDHEAMRICQLLGIADELLDDLLPVNRYEWFGADGELIVKFDLPSGPSGWPFSYTFFQPHLEDALGRAVAAAGVPVHRGWSLVGLTELDDRVELELERTDAEPGETRRRVYAKHVVGADGAHSTVRELLEIDFVDLGFAERWLVVDLLPTDPSLGFPDFPQQYCDPRRPHMWAPNGRRHRRWEFMLLPHETAEDFEAPERVWSMLAPWLDRSQGELVRHAVYEFGCRLATTMQSRRCFLAGDAGHVMPPHLGEGLCSGLRDANNLAWRLALTYNGPAGPEALESYSSERLPHVRELVEQSKAMGRISCELDPHAAATRDLRLRAAGSLEEWPFPKLGPGIVYGGSRGIRGAAGSLSVQGTIRRDGSSGRLDDVAGRGFKLIAAGAGLRDVLSWQQLASLDALGCALISLGEDATDADGELTRWLASIGAAAVLVRPDFYVFGAVAALDHAGVLVDDLCAQLPFKVRR